MYAILNSLQVAVYVLDTEPRFSDTLVFPVRALDVNLGTHSVVEVPNRPEPWFPGVWRYSNSTWEVALQPQFDHLLYLQQKERIKQVTRFQALAALHQAGLLVSVEAMMQGADILTKLAWDNALTFERDSPTVLAMGQALGLSSQNLDDLFIAAAQIRA